MRMAPLGDSARGFHASVESAKKETAGVSTVVLQGTANAHVLSLFRRDQGSAVGVRLNDAASHSLAVHLKRNNMQPLIDSGHHNVSQSRVVNYHCSESRIYLDVER